MPRNKDLKRIVRARMQKTGEAYTSARANINRSRAAPPVAQEDYAPLAGTAEDTLTEKTGRGWMDWVRELDRHDAVKMSHRDIAALLREEYGVEGWWSQTITVGYERIKGLRERGQSRSGTYEAGRSRTFNVPVDVLFDAWAVASTRRRWLVDVEATLRTATKPKSVRLAWPDGTLVVAGFADKGPKSTVGLAHQKLPDRASADRAKQEWAARLDALGELLKAPR